MKSPGGHQKLLSDQLSRQQIDSIIRELTAVQKAGVPGDVVEFGCYVGTCSVFLQRSLQAENTGRRLHVYDSFEGLPQKQAQDQSPSGFTFIPGSLKTSKKDLVANFKKANLPLPIIHKGWFENLDVGQLPGRIAFAFLDGDFYSSIHTSLRLIWPCLSAGAVVVVDDYASEALPGVGLALRQWLGAHPAKLRVERSLAIISKSPLHTSALLSEEYYGE
jgi:O-methyltransferase